MADSNEAEIRLKAELDLKAAERQAELDAEAARRQAEIDEGATERKSQIDAAAAAQQAVVDAQAAVRATRVEYDKAYFQTMLDVEKAAIDRWRSSAELVQKAAAAIGTLYGAILGVTFSVSNRQLPIRGVVPAVFLGLSIVASTVYVAYATSGKAPEGEAIPDSPPLRLQNRLNYFYTLVRENVGRRLYWLRASVVALGLGVAFLPAPFVTFVVPNPPNLDTQYPWPSPPSVADPQTATIVSIVYKSQVDETVANRQRAKAAQDATADLGLWAVATGVGILLVFLLPTLGRPRQA